MRSPRSITLRRVFTSKPSQVPRLVAPPSNRGAYPSKQLPFRTIHATPITMPGLQLSYTPDGTAYDDGAAFSSIKSFLEGGSDTTSSQAAKALANTLTGPSEADGDDAHYSLYMLLIDLAKQIPHNDPSLVRLVNIIDELSRSPKTSFTDTVDGAETLCPMYTFNWNLRDVFNPPFEPGRQPSEAQLSAYLSLHAFMAMLWTRGIINGYDFAIWQLRSAFEEDIDDDTESTYEAATASLWVIHAGPRLWQNVVDPPSLSTPEERSLKTGQKLDAGPGYSQQRWEFWAKSLEERSGADTFDGKLAERALSVMNGLEG